MRRAKIIATIGPSSKSLIDKLIESGMDVARLNFSHGTYDEFAEIIKSIRNSSILHNKAVTILQDLQGPKLRVGELPETGITLSTGQEIFLATDSGEGINGDLPIDALVIPFDVPNLIDSLRIGKKVLIDDGHIIIEVIEVNSNYIKATVLTGGLLLSHKGVNFPDVDLKIPGFTEKDHNDLLFGLEQNIDIIALSFIRSASDVARVKEMIASISNNKIHTPIIAKLELPQAIENLEEILDVADGVMVARGDLAVETSPSKVPILQKRIIDAANNKGKIVITATQMLDSMINNPLPTRAEASDVANAVFDGTDALMLSGETASGIYPVESISMMDAIICEAETNSSRWGRCQVPTFGDVTDDAISLTWAARELAHDRNVKGIAVFTDTGRTAKLMAKTRPQVPILAFTPNPATYQNLGITWGVIPHLVPFASTVESMLKIIDDAIIEIDFIKNGDQVILICGFPVGSKRPPNFALLHTICDLCD